MPKRVLIADDDPGIVDAVMMMLEFYDYEASYVYDGAELLHFTGNLPDLILLDIWMAGTDGRDVCRALKARADLKNIPVIMISASKDISESALAAGADDFLAKPFDMEELISKIETMLDKSQLDTSCAA